eukprot:TRINITY_DN66988_c4_g9_i1.p1 TRINITY_DN66988_c4_g9~~TRINITY_DN66988_c4_g9_i1.p1  ORF type:complete len:452 (+),score=7.55 TRINITY_DN66988_c4_g9_i1:33-1388(+)
MQDFSRCTCNTHARLGKQNLVLNTQTNVRVDPTQPLTLSLQFKIPPRSLLELVFLHCLEKDNPEEPSVLETRYSAITKTLTAELTELEAGCSYSVQVNHEAFFAPRCRVITGPQDSDLVYGFTILHPKSGPPPRKPWTLKCKTLTGKVVHLQASPSDTPHHLKALLALYEGEPPNDQRLITNSKQLTDGLTLEEAGVKDGQTLVMVLRLRGNGDFISNHLTNARIGHCSLLGTPDTRPTHNLQDGANSIILTFDDNIGIHTLTGCVELKTRFGRKTKFQSCTWENNTLIAVPESLEEGVTYRLEVNGNCFSNNGQPLTNHTFTFLTVCSTLTLRCGTETASATKTGKPRTFVFNGGHIWQLVSQLPWQLWEHDLHLPSTPNPEQVQLHLVHPDTRLRVPLKNDQDVLKLVAGDLLVVSIANKVDEAAKQSSKHMHVVRSPFAGTAVGVDAL